MESFAGLDVSMSETHVCVVTRNGAVIHGAKVLSTLAVLFGVQLPRARSSTFNRQALQASEGIPACLPPCEV
jgi:hypothetical protein